MSRDFRIVQLAMDRSEVGFVCSQNVIFALFIAHTHEFSRAPAFNSITSPNCFVIFGFLS